MRTNTRISGVKLSDEGVLQCVSIFSAQCSETLPCDDLILAAGPWTPRLFKELFPSANLDFHETTNSGNWIIVKSPASLSAESFCEVILVELVTDSRLEFVGQRDDNSNSGVIYICGIDNKQDPIEDVEKEIEPDKEAVTRLSDYAHRYLAALSKATLESPTTIVATGRSYRPTNTTHIPIITAVASEDLRRRSDNAADEPILDSLNSGVWVCTGHGMYGISLGMGSGKLLSEMILGEKLGVDISMLGFRRVVGSIPALSES